jgi:hypothetical protein
MQGLKKALAMQRRPRPFLPCERLHRMLSHRYTVGESELLYYRSVPAPSSTSTISEKFIRSRSCHRNLNLTRPVSATAGVAVMAFYLTSAYIVLCQSTISVSVMYTSAVQFARHYNWTRSNDINVNVAAKLALRFPFSLKYHDH